MRNKLKVLSLVTLLSFFSSANAGILVEPYIGYYLGTYKAGSSKENFSGPDFGARVGYKNILGLMFGVDYLTGKMEDKASPSNDLTPSQIGAFIGFEFPILLRVYGVYSLSDKLERKSDTQTLKLEGNSGIKLGVGYTGLPLISINLEYSVSKYDKSNDSSLSGSLKQNSYGLSVSLPFDL